MCGIRTHPVPAMALGPVLGWDANRGVLVRGSFRGPPVLETWSLIDWITGAEAGGGTLGEPKNVQQTQERGEDGGSSSNNSTTAR
jgi:hypothetical protein